MSGGEQAGPVPSGEWRRDAMSGRWVSVAANRMKRPNRPSTDCPFCVGGLEAPEAYETKVFENRWPSLAGGAPVDPADVDESELFATLPARGACDVVLYSPEHDATLGTMPHAQVRAVVDLWADRTTTLLQRPEVEYVLVFENRGADAGATIPHPHGQVYSFPWTPPEALAESDVAARRGSCQFCAIAGAEAGGEREVVRHGAWSSHVPFAAGWPYATVLVGDEHVTDLASLDEAGRDDFAAVLGATVRAYDALFGEPFPYMFWVHQGLHVHAHFAPPWRSAGVTRYVASGEVGSGTWFNPVAPEGAAAALREALAR